MGWTSYSVGIVPKIGIKIGFKIEIEIEIWIVVGYEYDIECSMN